MSIYYSVRVSKVLLCDCSSYKFPHSVGNGLCSSVVPLDSYSICCRPSRTAIKRAKDLVSNGYI
jgi:hypothetical protein